MQRLLRYIAAFSLLAIGLFSVVSLAHAQTGPSLGIAGEGWHLTQIQRSAGNSTDTSDVTITINFDDQWQASGHSTCNSYGASYQQGADNSLTFSDFLQTFRACVDTRLMGLENEYFAALQNVTSYNLNNDTLQLFYNGGNSVLTFEPTPVPGTTGTTGGTTIGMPQTGLGVADITPSVIFGVSLLLLGASLLVWRRLARSA